ncbi:MAG: pilus assembly protein [Sphingomonadales bacterium]|nr:pilus assembly protein [Sphingomonadales bacterium]
MLKRRAARLSADDRGAAIVEFAMVLPMLLTLFLGTFVMSDTLSCYRKVTVAARSLADIISRSISPSSTPSAALLAPYFAGTQLTMSPFTSAYTTMEIDELRVCDATHAYVMWSQAQSAGVSSTPLLTAGTVVSVPASMITTPMIPTSPDGSNVCNNTTPAANRTVVGTAGVYMMLGRVNYAYQPVYSFASMARYNVTDQIYMIPRLN